MQRYLIGLGVILLVVVGYLYLNNNTEVVKEKVGHQVKPNSSSLPQGGGDNWWQQKQGDKPAAAKPSSGDETDVDTNAATEDPIQLQEDITPEQWNAQFADAESPDLSAADVPSQEDIMSEPAVDPQATLAPPPFEVPEGYQQDTTVDTGTYSDEQPIDMGIDDANVVDADITGNMMIDDGTTIDMMVDQ